MQEGEKKKKQPDDAGRGSFDGKRFEGVGKVHGAGCRTAGCSFLQAWGLNTVGCTGNSRVPGARRHEGAGEAQKKRAPPIPALGTAIRIGDGLEWRRES